jgi:hypothetical protein
MEKNEVDEKGKKATKKPENDGLNTPVPDGTAVKNVSKSEAELFRQARNPLGDPNKNG